MRLAAQEKRDREIATMLGIRPKTVGNHLRRKRCAFSDKKAGISLLTNGKAGCNINDKAFHPYCLKGVRDADSQVETGNFHSRQAA
ncbi:MAG: hypothetical protein H5T61_08805 [Thermoflexales bacterium]|nr:hypothetical protein [Thermoflexales bacterium]